MFNGTRSREKCIFLSKNFCYFVVWTTKDVAVLKIERDESWAANIPLLTQFYFNYIFSKIVVGELLSNINNLF